jgi:hypothetical protein
MEQTQCSKTLAYKTQTPGNYPEESIQHSEQGESLKSINSFSIAKNDAIIKYKIIYRILKTH